MAVVHTVMAGDEGTAPESVATTEVSAEVRSAMERMVDQTAAKEKAVAASATPSTHADSNHLTSSWNISLHLLSIG